MLSQSCSCNYVSQISHKLLRLGKHVLVIDIMYSWKRWKAVLWGRNQLCFHSNSDLSLFTYCHFEIPSQIASFA